MASIDPTDKQLAAIANSDSDEPIVMLNLNKYRDKAEYLDPKLGNDLSGRDAYLRYGVVAVITSYSIHYTKLYESSLHTLTKHTIYCQIIKNNK